MAKNNRIPKHCFEIYRRNHPEENHISDIEIELEVQLGIREVVIVFYQCIEDVLANFGKEGNQLEERQRLKESTISKLQNRLIIYNNSVLAFEALCGSDLEITNFLHQEGETFFEIFKEFVEQNMNITMQYFVNHFADYSSLDSLMYFHHSINKMNLDIKASLGVGDAFSDRIKRIIVKSCDNLLEFYNGEFDREIRKQQIENRVFYSSLPKEMNKVKNILVAKEEKLKITFDDLFLPRYKSCIDSFVQILRDVTPELINADDHWIGAKNAARIYVSALKMHNVIDSKTTEQTPHLALSDRFPNLGKSFMKKPAKRTRAEDYYVDMEERINQVKQMITT